MITEILLACAGLCIVLYLVFAGKRPNGFPKGPNGLPIVGFLPYLDRANPPAHFARLSEKYGSVLGIRLGSKWAVVLNELSVIKEALKDDIFSGRPHTDVFLTRSEGQKKGIIFNDGKEWQEQRRFTLRNLKDFGFGKNSLENIILHEVQELVVDLRKDIDKPINLKFRFNLPILNTLWRMVSGDRYDLKDPKIMQFFSSVIRTSGGRESNSGSGPLVFLPWLYKLIPKSFNSFSRIEKIFKQECDIVQGEINKHEETFSKDNLRDLIDVTLKHIHETSDENSSFFKGNGYLNLRTTVSDLFIAGSDTSTRTLQWGLLYMLKYPDAKEKVHCEIDAVLGRDRLPTLKDRALLPRTEATIMEIMRFSSIVPLSVHHCTTQDTVFKGYNIPKDTMVMVNLYNVMHDPSLWERPEEFYPQHFLTEVNTIRKREEFIPFSTGKRICLGERLALDEIFLFFTSIMQQFDFSVPPGQTLPSLNGIFSLIRRPRDYEIIFHNRV